MVIVTHPQSQMFNLCCYFRNLIGKYKSEFTNTTISVNVTNGPANSDSKSGSKSDESQEANRGGRTWRGRGGRNNRGRGRGRYGSSPRPTCQICFMFGHDAFNCWSRFHENFVQPDPPPPTVTEQAHPYSYQAPAYHQQG